MSKRNAEQNGVRLPASKRSDRNQNVLSEGPQGEYEDEFEDEFESEDEIVEAGVDGRPDEEREKEEGWWFLLRSTSTTTNPQM